MIDTTTQKSLRVLGAGREWPYINLPLSQLDEVRRLLDAHQIRYWVSSNVISINGLPEEAMIQLARGTDAAAVHALLGGVDAIRGELASSHGNSSGAIEVQNREGAQAMIDTTTQQPLKVMGTARHYINLPYTQLAEVSKLLDAHQVIYWVSEQLISVNGSPEVARIQFARGTDADSVQAILDRGH